MSERQTLLQSLADKVQYFKDRVTVGMMKTEHSIFIPSALIIDQAEETEAFIVTAREIGKVSHWGCPVTAEKQELPVPGGQKLKGVEFVFSFSGATDFDAILEEIRRQQES
jgi:hypothetical protein